MKYTVSVLDKVTGAEIPEGGVVSVGQDIILKFEAHKGTDIDWFTVITALVRRWTTTSGPDSPHGSWKQNAMEPDVIDEDDKLSTGRGVLIGIHTDRFSSSHTDRETARYIYTHVYAALTVNHPIKTIETPSNLTCGALSGIDSSGAHKMQCEVNADGPININFKFSDTYGKFYSPTLLGEPPIPAKPYNQMLKLTSLFCYTHSHPPRDPGPNHTHCSISKAPFTLAIPATSIPYTLNASAVQNDPPSPPTIDAPDSVCVNEPITITLSGGIDHDGDRIHYGLNYEGESAPTEWTPFIASGESDSVTHTHGLPLATKQ